MQQDQTLAILAACAERAVQSPAPTTSEDRLFFFVTLLAYALAHQEPALGAKLLDLADAGAAEHAARALSWDQDSAVASAT